MWHIDDESQLEWQAAVRPAFRKLAAKLHPDVAGTVQHDVVVQGISRVFYARVFRALTCWLLCATSTIAGPGTGDPAAFRKVLWVTSTCLVKLVRRTFVILLLFQRPCKRCCEITQSIEFLNFRRIENSQKVMVGADGETNVVARRSGLIWLDVFLTIFVFCQALLLISWHHFSHDAFLEFFGSRSLLRNPSNSTTISKICSKSCSRQSAWGKVTVFLYCFQFRIT